MPELTFNNGAPPPDEFRRALTQAIAESNPLDDLLELASELGEYEQKYNMSSSDFYMKYQAGLSGDDLYCMEWAGTYELFMKTRRSLESALMRAAVQTGPDEHEYKPLPVYEPVGHGSEHLIGA